MSPLPPLPSPRQPVPCVSSSGAQRDSAEAVQGSATPPSGGPQCARAPTDTCVRNPTLPTPRVPVSAQEIMSLHTLLLYTPPTPQTHQPLIHFLPLFYHLCYLWCPLTRLHSSALLPIVSLPGFEMRFFCDRSLAGRGLSLQSGVGIDGLK